MKTFPIDRLHQIFHYEPATRFLIWLINRRGHALKGRRAGTQSHGGRWYVAIDGSKFSVSRIAWAIMTGAWPEREIDHRDLDASNDRWDNLREATHSQQSANQRRRCTNNSGYKGVSLHRQSGLWRARLGANSESLGYFKTPEEAHAAYVAAAVARYGEFARAA